MFSVPEDVNVKFNAYPKAKPWAAEVVVSLDDWEKLSGAYWESVRDIWEADLKSVKKYKLKDKAIKKSGGEEKFYSPMIEQVIRERSKEEIIQFINFAIIKDDTSVCLGATYYVRPSIVWLGKDGSQVDDVKSVLDIDSLIVEDGAPNKQKVEEAINDRYERELEILTRQNSALKDSEAGHQISDGDVVTFDILNDDGTRGNATVWMVKSRFNMDPAAFYDALLGKAVGDSLDVETPEKKYKIVVTTVKLADRPSLDDSLAAKVGFLNAEALKTALKDNAHRGVVSTLRSSVVEVLTARLSSNAMIEPIPTEFVFTNANKLWASYRAQCKTEKEAFERLGVVNRENAIGKLGDGFIKDYIRSVLLSAYGRSAGISGGPNEVVNAVVSKIVG